MDNKYSILEDDAEAAILLQSQEASQEEDLRLLEHLIYDDCGRIVPQRIKGELL